MISFFFSSDSFPAPTRVGERSIRSKLIPDQARALANALKQAVVRPLKKTMTKKKSVDSNIPEQQLLTSPPPLSNPPSTFLDNSDHQLNELSVDSYESASLLGITPPPAKPPRQNEESSSSSSIEINSPPPAKPPRHFSVYKNADELNYLRRTTTDQFVQLQTSDSLKNIDRFTVEPIRIAMNTDVPLQSEAFEQPITINVICSTKQSELIDRPPDKIVSYATNLTKKILHDIKKEINRSNRERLLNRLTQLEQQQQQQTSREISSSFSHPVVTTHISPIRSSKIPLMSVSLDSEVPLTSISKRSPLLEIVTTKPTPIFTTSVTVTSSSSSLVSSTATITNSEENLGNTSTLIPSSNKHSDRSKSCETNSKRNSIDSSDLIPYDNSQNTGNATPARSLLSEYDNLHGSYGSLNDDNHTTHTATPLLPSSSSSSMTTIYESLDNFPSSSSTATSRTYVSAVSTFNTGGTRTPSQRLNSDISDEDLVDSFDIERSSQGTRTKMFISPSWHVFDLSFFPPPNNWHGIRTFASLKK